MRNAFAKSIFRKENVAGLQIVHTKMQSNGEVKVYTQKPDAKDGVHHVYCFLPAYRWEDIFGFSNTEMKHFQEVIESTAHLIMEFSQHVDFDHSASFKIRSYFFPFGQIE